MALDDGAALLTFVDVYFLKVFRDVNSKSNYDYERFMNLDQRKKRT